jgi:hypothetical protein
MQSQEQRGVSHGLDQQGADEASDGFPTKGFTTS